MEQHLPRLGDEEDAFSFAVGGIFLADAAWAAVAEAALDPAGAANSLPP